MERGGQRLGQMDRDAEALTLRRDFNAIALRLLPIA